MLDKTTLPPLLPKDIVRVDRLLAQLKPFSSLGIPSRHLSPLVQYRKLVAEARKNRMERDCKEAKEWLDKKGYLVTRRALICRTGYSLSELQDFFARNIVFHREMNIQRAPRGSKQIYVPREP